VQAERGKAKANAKYCGAGPTALQLYSPVDSLTLYRTNRTAQNIFDSKFFASDCALG
jgi:hypothetical protein